MLPIEKCLELKAAGYPQRQDEDGRVYCPSGDELLAECVQLLPGPMWLIERHAFAEGGYCTNLLNEDEIFHNRSSRVEHFCGGEHGIDLAKCWLWLKSDAHSRFTRAVANNQQPAALRREEEK